MVSLKWLPPLLQAIWWISFFWLSLAALNIIWWFIRWLSDSANPARYEYAIGAAIALVYSWPAMIGVLVAGIAPKTGLSTYKRVGGIALMLFCILGMLSFDFLQVRYR